MIRRNKQDANATGAAGSGSPDAGTGSQASSEAGSATAASTGQDPNGAPAGPGDGDGSPVDPSELSRKAEAAERAAKEARDEAARYRRQLREREKAEADAKRAGLDEQQKLEHDRIEFEKEREAFERERLEFRLQQQMVREIGPKLNLRDPADALWLIDWEKIDFDDDGKATNLEGLARQLAESKPYLVNEPSGPPAPPVAPTIGASAGSAPGPAPALTADELEAAQATGMDPTRYAQMKGVKTLDDYLAKQPGASGK